MQRQRLGRGGEPPVDVTDLLEAAEPLLVMVEHLEGDVDGVAEMQLLHVADMDFGRVDRHAALARIGGAGAKQVERLVHAAVEEHVVVGHVEMAVVVDPVRLDLHRARDEGGGNRHVVPRGLDKPALCCRLAIDSDPRKRDKRPEHFT